MTTPQITFTGRVDWLAPSLADVYRAAISSPLSEPRR